MKATMHLAAVVVAASPSFIAADGAEVAVATYRALYQVEYKEKPLGTSQFSVSYDAAREVYHFESRTTPKGLLKLVTPNPVIERSDFRIRNGVIQPLEFWYEDGSRKGEDNLHVLFDWDKAVAVVTAEAGRNELQLQSGVLDRGSMQVALMRDLAGSGRPGVYLLADGDSLKTYEYAANGEQPIKTGLGDLQTLAFVQQRENSSRSTWLWVAPQLQYLPVRIERRKDGEIQTAFTLESVEGLAVQAP
jgi:hypothetical protein